MSNNEKITGMRLLEDMTEEEKERARRIEKVLPALKERAVEADESAEFILPHIDLFKEHEILGLIVPKEYGGMGGGLRDLAAACYAMGTACPSTALAYFFHNSSVSRGTLPLAAVEEGLFDEKDVPEVKKYAEELLSRIPNQWTGNFASESAKSSQSAVFIGTEAKKTEGGWLLSGEKSFGCNTGTADEYLVNAKIEGAETVEGIALFTIKKGSEGLSPRTKWDAIGMRATATHGLILEDVFVSDEDALTIPNAFMNMLKVSRGSLTGNQVASIAIYLGAAQAVYDYALDFLMEYKFKDTGEPIATSPFHQELIGRMTIALENAYLWIRRQIELETSDPPIYDKDRVVMQWRMSKGQITEAAMEVATLAFKACGTGQTSMEGQIARGLRDISMGMVHAFPMERGRLEVAKYVVENRGHTAFSV